MNEQPSVMKLVKEVLATNKNTRSNDTLLALEVWKIQEKSLSCFFARFRTFEKKLLNKELHSFSSISKCRRIAQKKHITLRGVNYSSRQKYAGK